MTRQILYDRHVEWFEWLATPRVRSSRAGVPVVLEPDLNAGFELGVGGAYMLTAALGVGAELAGSVFYGAATLDQSASVIPLLSFQAGLWVDYEVLP